MLPTTTAVRERSCRLLVMQTSESLDLFSQFRDASVAGRSAVRALARRRSVLGEGLEMEALPERRRATLWPYRPHRMPDELLPVGSGEPRAGRERRHGASRSTRSGSFWRTWTGTSTMRRSPAGPPVPANRPRHFGRGTMRADIEHEPMTSESRSNSCYSGRGTLS